MNPLHMSPAHPTSLTLIPATRLGTHEVSCSAQDQPLDHHRHQPERTSPPHAHIQTSKQAVVLIVDDVPENLSLLHSMLEQAGYIVLVATDGQSALERVAKFTPDAILLDALMPGLSGFETCRLLKTNPLTQYIPVIFMTGLTESEYVVNGFEAGGVDYVTKPIRPSEVLARLATHINNSRLASQNRAAIDAAKIAILAISTVGELRWQTSSAARLLSNFPWLNVSGHDQQTPDPTPISLLAWIKQNDNSAFTLDWQGQHLALTKLGNTGVDTLLILVKQLDTPLQSSKAHIELIMRVCGLTHREAEVIHWVTLGKTNRDIGEILELSPRTVNKHLEHIFTKLGVETRTAAASIITAKIRLYRE